MSSRTLRVRIGKYRDKSMTYVFATDPRYLAWVASTVEGYDDVKETIDDLPDFDAHLTAYLRG